MTIKSRTLLHGDNLDMLRGIDSETIHLIATDPPFNKGRDFHATPDSVARGASFQDRWSWDKDVHEEWVDKITDDFPKVMNVIQGSRNSYGDDMGAFLCFMGVRLLEMHRVLKPTGSMYLHCDPTASHYLKELMDAVFGKDNFRNEIIWRRTGSHNSAERFGPIHDTILFYAKSDKYSHNTRYNPYLRGHIDEYFKNSDKRGKYWTNSIHGSGIRHGNSGKPWRGFDPTAAGRHWAVPSELVTALSIDPKLSQHEKLDALYERGVIDLPPSGSKALPTYRQYLHNSLGIPLQDVWAYQPHTEGCLHGTDNPIDADVRWIPKRDKSERQGYPTQKPVGLYERIILSSSRKGDIVLDPFCGCATTCVAAEKLGRKWIGIDIWDKAHEVVIKRLKKEGYLAGPDGKHDGIIVTEGMITYSKVPPERTDGGSEAVPFLETRMKKFDETERDPYTNARKKEILLERHGSVCQGCGIELHERYLELDHQLPRADGGSNLLRNRILLCGPCNKLKRHLYTISWLRRENKRLGYMVNEGALASLK